MKGKFSDIYITKKPLVCCQFPTLNRGIGVRVGYPSYNIGGHENTCEVTYEFPSLNTSSYGRNTPITELNKQVLKSNQSVIKKLDVVILELKQHRKRLIDEGQKISSGALNLDELAQNRITT